MKICEQFQSSVKQTLVARKVFDGLDVFLTALCQLSVGFLDNSANQNRNN